MKKVVSLLLVAMLSCTFLCPAVFAQADVTFSASSIRDLIAMLDDNMPGAVDTQAGQALRAQVFGILELYTSTDLNMDSLMETVEKLEDGGFTIPTDLQDIVTQLGTDLTDNKDAVLLVLCMFRALPQEARAAAIADFKAAQQAVEDKSVATNTYWVSEEVAGVALESVDQAALQAVYDSFVNVNASGLGHDKMGTHGVGPNTILRLFKAFQGHLLLTDSDYGSSDFALASYSDEYADAVEEQIGNYFASINGETDLSFTSVMNQFLAAANDFESELQGNIKSVLGASEIGLYAALERKDDDEDTGSNRRPGGSSSSSKDDVTNVVPDTDSEPPMPPAAGEAYIYTDTAGHWAQDYIAELTKRGIFNGYDDGSFRPDLNITREEIAVAMTRALGLEDEARKARPTSFVDEHYISLWAVDSVNMMVQHGIFTGYDDGTFKPKQIISREELVAVVIRVFTSDLPSSELTYTDHEHVGDWARAYLEKATEMSIVGGYPDGSFQPKNPVTRAEAAKILYNFMHYAGFLK